MAIEPIFEFPARDSLRWIHGDAARYEIELHGHEASYVSYAWRQEVDATLDGQIIGLMRQTTTSSPIIGFGGTISDAEATGYLKELRENLAAGKCRLLTICASDSAVIGLCTLRRNLNPNNRHIADLAKGMIAQRYRGRIVLAAAFYEIALQCERDGVEVVTLDVRADTSAQHIWERYGFDIYGTLKDYARANGESFAGHFMMQKVDDLKSRALIGLLAKKPGNSAEQYRGFRIPPPAQQMSSELAYGES